jgi:hypothetical protein
MGKSNYKRVFCDDHPVATDGTAITLKRHRLHNQHASLAPKKLILQYDDQNQLQSASFDMRRLVYEASDEVLNVLIDDNTGPERIQRIREVVKDRASPQYCTSCCITLFNQQYPSAKAAGRLRHVPNGRKPGRPRTVLGDVSNLPTIPPLVISNGEQHVR